MRRLGCCSATCILDYLGRHRLDHAVGRSTRVIRLVVRVHLVGAVVEIRPGAGARIAGTVACETAVVRIALIRAIVVVRVAAAAAGRLRAHFFFRFVRDSKRAIHSGKNESLPFPPKGKKKAFRISHPTANREQSK